MASAFNTQGSTPNVFGNSQSAVSPIGIGSTPAARALSGSAASSGIGTKPDPFNPFPMANMSTPQGPRYSPPPTIPAPSTPVKKTTVNNVDGSSHVTEYHAPPDTTTTAATAPVFSGILGAGTGSIVPQGGTSGTPVQQPTDSSSFTTSQPQTQLSTATTGLLNAPSQNAAIAQEAQGIRNNYQGLISQVGNLGAGAQAGDLSTGTNVVGEGNAAIASQSASQRMNALANDESQQIASLNPELTAQSQSQSGLNQAGSLSTPSNQFTQVPYSNQLIGADGQPVTGGQTGTLPAQAQTFVNSLATQVQNGQMTRDEATSQLSAYGTAGLQALNTALGSNFNTNASNASAGTTATGQQIQTAADSTNKALDTLSTSFGSLNGLQTGGIPLTNSIAQWIGANLGDATLQQYKTNLADARSQLIGVLNSAGGTPTGNEATAEQYLPDNMTPAQFQQNVGTAQNPGIVRQLVQQKVSSFTSSGQQNNSNAQSTTQPIGYY